MLIPNKSTLRRESKGLDIYVDMKFGEDYRLVKISRKEAERQFDLAQSESHIYDEGLLVEGHVMSDSGGKFFVMMVEVNYQS